MRFLIILLLLTAPLQVAIGQDSLLRIGKIHISGNKKTRPTIILRELHFQEGQTLSKQELYDKIELSRQQLVNLKLFNYVDIRSRFNDSSTKTDIHIEVIERWFIWVIPEFKLADRNFNQWWLTKDFARTNYGFRAYLLNLWGANQTLKISFIHGYTQLYELRYSVPYINKKKTLGLALESRFSQNHEIWLDTRDNKLQFLNDDDRFTIRRFRSSAGLILRNDMRRIHRFDLSYIRYLVTDSVLKTDNNPRYLANGSNNQEELEPSYVYQADFRNNTSYPTKGRILRLEVSTHFINEPNGPHFCFLSAEESRYWQLSKRWFSSAGLKIKGNIGAGQPYLNLVSLGYKDFVRGYEYYVIDGQGAILSKASIKFALIPDGEYYVRQIPFKGYRHVNRSLYLTAFTDVGYVDSDYKNNINPLNNTVLWGGGIGLDAIMYYDRFLRLECSMNRNKELGLYLHFVIAI